jgi:nucleoid-associated protein YgaU
VANAAVNQREHVVEAGDTLSAIALQYYGTASRWREILNANRDVLRDERRLSVGLALKIP